jgi:dolichol-phosphate mannosyltransferase
VRRVTCLSSIRAFVENASLQAASGLRFSLVIPLFNEEENVDRLIDELRQVLPPLGPHEVIAVDDGSTDDTFGRLDRRRADCPALRIVRLRHNRGQSAALMAGFDHAHAPLLCMIDGDLQNDPRDLDRILEGLATHEGVSGWRVERRDGWFRRFQSRVANRFRNWISGDHVADSASGIKGFRREAILRVPRFRGMHRFLPTLVRMAGGSVVEIPVNHRPRAAGRPKYGMLNRAARAFFDLLGVRWLKSRLLRYEIGETR